MKILLRTKKSTNPFRKYLMQLSQIEGDILILAYGFIYEVVKYDKDFINSIDIGFSKISGEAPKNFVLLGGYFTDCICDDSKYCNKCQFEKFAKYCTDYFDGKFPKVKPNSKNVKVHTIYSTELPNLSALSSVKDHTSKTKWHGKIALKINTNLSPSVMATMVGSSNLSKPALSVGSDSSSECDIYTWDGNKLKNLNSKTKTDRKYNNPTDILNILEDLNVNPKDVNISDYQKGLYLYMKMILDPKFKM